MIKIEHLETCGWEAAIRGMRNPMNSWDKSDSVWGCELNECNQCGYEPSWCGYGPSTKIGPNDADLMKKLRDGGPMHAKYRRMITVYCDITAPLYWWKEYDTYKVGTVANSCSTMHKLGEKEFELEDFSCEKLVSWDDDFKCDIVYNFHYAPDGYPTGTTPNFALVTVINVLNEARNKWLVEKDAVKKKLYWYNMIQLLPSSYNQKRTVELNYEVLAGIYKWRKDHKLDEWREFCRIMAEQLPESWIFTGEEGN